MPNKKRAASSVARFFDAGAIYARRTGAGRLRRFTVHAPVAKISAHPQALSITGMAARSVPRCRSRFGMATTTVQGRPSTAIRRASI